MAERRTILITGYWPPTNEMVRPWSPTHAAPGGAPGSGWIGRDWEGRGYDVVSYFPEFPGRQAPNWGRGTGWLEVDYFNTARDFEVITSRHRPIAIVTCSRANTHVGWEVEPATQRFRLLGEASPPGRSVAFYVSDFSIEGARYPTNVAIAGEPVGNIRASTLPMEAIVERVGAEMDGAAASPFIAAYDPANPDTFDFGGNFLSGYIGYLGSWYQARNAPGRADLACYAAGHIHVGTNMRVESARRAMEITLRVVIGRVDQLERA